MRAKRSVPEPPVLSTSTSTSTSTRVISDVPSGTQGLIRQGKTLRLVLERGASRVTLTALSAMHSRWRMRSASGCAAT